MGINFPSPQPSPQRGEGVSTASLTSKGEGSSTAAPLPGEGLGEGGTLAINALKLPLGKLHGPFGVFAASCVSGKHVEKDKIGDGARGFFANGA